MHVVLNGAYESIVETEDYLQMIEQKRIVERKERKRENEGGRRE